MRKAGNQLEYSMDVNRGSDHFGGLIFCGEMTNRGKVAVKRLQLVHVNIENIPKFKKEFMDRLIEDHPYILPYLLAEKYEYFL